MSGLGIFLNKSLCDTFDFFLVLFICDVKRPEKKSNRDTILI